ncbi:hypothetical protein CVD25_03510 [Bacillus canaveralius]|uniref:GntR family transcriptional regulator n=1 Tax=Bacillus canaveralius TaxID=1403243 RepID=A0A2N5GSB6_9BACI|nr:GntR family transcriptional regulator YhfZ [Bacillus canaveralius]PLR86546.1 hypothetical protein CU635_01105 [Bacillus canaveralius]PLS00317.1 hypothetical protein CVD25_03510 [Bacillus canaveralius]
MLNNKLSQSLFSKQGAVAAELAREFLQFQVGDRIPRITDYAVQFGVGNGTIQAAVQTLVDIGALQLESKGHKGTHIEAIDYLVLWQATGREVIFGALALPYTNLLAGMATGLKQVFTVQNIPSSLAFMRGVVSRAKALKAKRNDFIVCSRLSGETLCENDPELEIWCRFGPGTHVSNHVIFKPQGAEENFFQGMKVCVDKDSLDQFQLTQAEFGHLPVEFLEVGYMQIPHMLQSRQADAAVWNVDEIVEKNLPLSMFPLKSDQANDILPKCTEAVIVIQKHSGVGNFLNHIIDPDEVIKIQKNVVNGLTPPAF